MTTICSNLPRIGGRRAADTVREGEWLADLWQLTFRCRHLAIAAIAVLAAIMPTFGDQRWLVVVPLVFVVLPYDFLLER